MSDPSSSPNCVLIVADPGRISPLVDALAEPLPQGMVEPLVSAGGDDTIELFQSRKPVVVVVAATLEAGDSATLIDAMRGMVPAGHVGFVLVGDDDGPHRTALDAAEHRPDAFVTSPVSDKALRYAVGSTLERVLAARGLVVPIVAGAHDTPPPRMSVQRARLEALADRLLTGPDDDLVPDGDQAVEPHHTPGPSHPDDRGSDEAAPLPAPIDVRHRRGDGRTDRSQSPLAPPQAWRPGTTAELVPVREPTLIIRDPEPEPNSDEAAGAQTSGEPPRRDSTNRIGDSWNGAMPLADLLAEPSRRAAAGARSGRDELGMPLDDFDDDLVMADAAPPERDLGDASKLQLLIETPVVGTSSPPPPDGGRDFARQLRAKMSQMAQRLFQGAGPAAPPAVELGPRHDHSTEIDLAALGEDVALDRGVTEIEAQAALKHGDESTPPASWDTQIRERGLPDTGEIVRGLSDAPLLLTKMFAQSTTGRISFRDATIEKTVFFDQGRPVFAASSERTDRMGELLVREGKITAAQYERCQAVVADSGRRMGEILVGLDYLKRRELLPAVRRHVEDIVYSLFSWEHGTYQIIIDPAPCAERIRLSRHPAALILEGIRRKLDRSTLERLVGPATTVIEVPDRERLGGIINLGDLAPEERGALAGFDSQADLASVARTARVDVADVMPLAWGLCVLGLATARRPDTEVHDESSALVGATDLAIDRERVRARWRLVEEADYFALLGVRRDATTFEIRRAYQTSRRDFAAEGFPPDLRLELARELDDIAHVLEEAFRVLRDDRLRATYLANLVEQP